MTAPLAKAKTQTPPVPFVRLEELPRGESVTGLIYGGSKTAKTWILGTAGNRCLFLDTGDGVATLHSLLFKQKVGANPIIVSIREKLGKRGVPEILPNVDAAFDVTCDVIDYALENFAADFDFVCCDELSAMRRFAMSKGLEYNQKTSRSHTLQKASELSVMIPAVQDYGVEMSLIEQFLAGTIRRCKDAGKHFFIAAHQRYTMEKPKDGRGNVLIGEPPLIKEIRPAVTGAQFPDAVSALFDNVFRAERVSGGEGAVYRLRTMGDEIIMAGTRHAGILPAVIRSPSLLKIVEHIKTSTPLKDIPGVK